MSSWTRVPDPDAAVPLLPAWFAARMMATRGSYGFLLVTGDVLRVSRITAVHVSPGGSILLDVLLDCAGVPGGVDLAWQPKHFLGAPVPGATIATLNLAQGRARGRVHRGRDRRNGNGGREAHRRRGRPRPGRRRRPGHRERARRLT